MKFVPKEIGRDAGVSLALFGVCNEKIRKNPENPYCLQVKEHIVVAKRCSIENYTYDPIVITSLDKDSLFDKWVNDPKIKTFDDIIYFRMKFAKIILKIKETNRNQDNLFEYFKFILMQLYKFDHVNTQFENFYKICKEKCQNDEPVEYIFNTDDIEEYFNYPKSF